MRMLCSMGLTMCSKFAVELSLYNCVGVLKGDG